MEFWKNGNFLIKWEFFDQMRILKKEWELKKMRIKKMGILKKWEFWKNGNFEKYENFENKNGNS